MKYLKNRKIENMFLKMIGYDPFRYKFDETNNTYDIFVRDNDYALRFNDGDYKVLTLKVWEEEDKKGNKQLKFDLDNLLIDNKCFKERGAHIHRFMIGGCAGDTDYSDLQNYLVNMYVSIRNFFTFLDDNNYNYSKTDINDVRNKAIIENFGVNYYKYLKNHDGGKFDKKFTNECVNECLEKMSDYDGDDIVFDETLYCAKSDINEYYHKWINKDNEDKNVKNDSSEEIEENNSDIDSEEEENELDNDETVKYKYGIDYNYLDCYCADYEPWNKKYKASKIYQGCACPANDWKSEVKEIEENLLETFKKYVGYKHVKINVHSLENNKTIEEYYFKNPYYIDLKKCSQEMLEEIYDKERFDGENLSVKDLKKMVLSNSITKEDLMENLIKQSTREF